MRKTLIRDLPDGTRIVAHLEIDSRFSLTGELYETAGRKMSGRARHLRGYEADAYGQLSDEILRAFPELAPFARVHLSDLAGVPMHGGANARYFLSGESDRYELETYGPSYLQRHGTGYERACSLLRIDAVPIAALSSDAGWSAFMAERREAWAYDAWEARRLFDALGATERTAA